MKKVNLVISLVIALLVSCTGNTETDLSKTAFIPKPLTVEASGKSFILSESVIVCFNKDEEKLKGNAEYLSAKLEDLSGFEISVELAEKAPGKGIYLDIDSNNDWKGGEAYEIIIDKKSIIINAASEAGSFYGIQTLLQTLPVNSADGEELAIPTGLIKDYPQIGYRGIMLDVARHFFEVGDVKRLIDLMSAYKYNHLHLHLSDDQGWRIEIKSWPGLTETGGSTEVGGGEGGYYTQDQYMDIIEYAAERYITIVPEIDMPGHTNAALASYAELNCDGKATELYTGIEVGFSSLCIDKEITYEFVRDVVREIAEMTPGPYFHIGGDESHATAPDDYIYFIDRVQNIVQENGKTVIGWDEIANATPLEGTIVQYWSDADNALLGTDKGAMVLMSPAKYSYLDMKYDSTTTLGLDWAGYIEVDKAYKWDPAMLVDGLTEENIFGLEAPMWSETVSNMDELEYMLFPRLPGYAEIGWTATELRSWDDYKLRLAAHGKRFEDLGINYYKSDLVPWPENE